MNSTNHYHAGRVKVNFRNQTYETDYLDWYKKTLEEGSHSTPTWVIDMQSSSLLSEVKSAIEGNSGQFSSDIKNNSSFYPIYAYTSKSTTYSHATSNILGMNLDAGVQIERVLVVIPHGVCYASLMQFHTNRKPAGIIVKKFINTGTVLMDHSIYSFGGCTIDHVEMLNGDEIAFLFAPKVLDVQEFVWNNAGQKVGNLRYKFDYSTGTFGESLLGAAEGAAENG